MKTGQPDAKTNYLTLWVSVVILVKVIPAVINSYVSYWNFLVTQKMKTPSNVYKPFGCW